MSACTTHQHLQLQQSERSRESPPPAPPAPPWGHLMAQAPLRVTAPQCKLQGNEAEHVAVTRFAEPAASSATRCHLALRWGHPGMGTPEDRDTRGWGHGSRTGWVLPGVPARPRSRPARQVMQQPSAGGSCPAQSRDRGQFLGSLPSPQLATGDSQRGASLLPSSCLPPALSSGQDPQGHLHHPCPGWHQAGTRLDGGGWRGERRRGCCLFCSRASLRAKRQQQLSARRGESGSLLISTPTHWALGAGRRAGAGRS